MVAGIRDDLPLEDAVEIAGWMARTKRVPAYDEWSPDGAAEAAASQNEALF